MSTVSAEPKLFGNFGIKAELLILFAFSLSLAVYDAMYYFLQYYHNGRNGVFNGIFFGILVVLQSVGSLMGFLMIHRNSQVFTQKIWKVIALLFVISNFMGFIGLIFKAFTGNWVAFVVLDTLLFLVSVTILWLTIHRMRVYKNWEQLRHNEE